MSADRIEIDSDALRDQARAVDTAAGRVQEAQHAIASMNLTGDAFGIMCGFLIPPTLVVTTAASMMLTQAAGMLDRESAALRATAADFDEMEDDTASDIRGLGAFR